MRTSSSATAQRPTLVRFLAPPGVDRSLVYQRYYLLGLETVVRTRWDGAPRTARFLPGMNNKMRLVYRLRNDRGGETGFVGRYVADFGGETVRFAIDAHDAREVRDPDALTWSDTYFKSNRWSSERYEAKVAPLVNGNGLLDHRRIALLRELRGRERDLDVAFISNFRGGRPHMLKLFEALAKLPVRSDLLAIFDGADPEDDTRYARALQAAGVPTATKQLAPETLWARLARAKTVLIRAGRHACVPWRMIDLLCMGACTVLDAPFPSPWPVPLRNGVDHADCAMARPLDGTAAAAAEYEKLGATIARLLEQPQEAARIRAGAARYFDSHAAPEQVAAYLLQTCADRLPG